MTKQATSVALEAPAIPRRIYTALALAAQTARLFPWQKRQETEEELH